MKELKKNNGGFFIDKQVRVKTLVHILIGERKNKRYRYICILHTKNWFFFNWFLSFGSLLI